MMRDAMTTLGEVLTPEGESAGARRARVWPRLLVGFLLGFVLCLGLAGGGLLAYDLRHDGRVLTGVTVGSVDLSGLDYDEASAALQVAFGSYGDGRVVICTSSGYVSVGYRRVRAAGRHRDHGRRGDAHRQGRDSVRARGRRGPPGA